MLFEGDKIFLGECGVSLSGGQCVCVNLVCVVYSDGDIYLMDDFFSVVDVKVGKYIFENCINGLFSNKVCVFVIY